MTIFGGFWLPFGRPLELILALWASFWSFKKRVENKDAKNEQTLLPPGPVLRNARTPGEDLGGVKTQQKGAEQKVHSKTEEEISESS